MIIELMVAMMAAIFAPQSAHPPAAFKTQIKKISRAARGHVGAAVMLVETGEAISVHGDQHFPMQSVYKFPIGMAVLHDVDAGRVKLDQNVRVGKGDLLPAGFHSPIRDTYPRGNVDLTVRELLRFMVAESDGTASDVLLRLTGGPERVNQYLSDLGVHDVTVATSEMEMSRGPDMQYRNWATPSATVG
jgi:beta-lactamase class A